MFHELQQSGEVCHFLASGWLVRTIRGIEIASGLPSLSNRKFPGKHADGEFLHTLKTKIGLEKRRCNRAHRSEFCKDSRPRCPSI